MTSHWWLTWYNLIYVLPFLAALLYLVMYAATGITLGDADAEAEIDADAHADIDADAEAEVDAHADVGSATDAHAEGHADPVDARFGVDSVAPPGAPAMETVQAIRTPSYLRVMRSLGLEGRTVLGVLRFFGVGRVPLSILLMAWFFAWGFLGVAVNVYAFESLPRFALEPWQVSLPIALAGSGLMAKGMSEAFARWMPTTETYARERATLVGRVGEALLPIDGHFGMAVVRDQRGNSHQVPCRVRANSAPLGKGARVQLVGYDVAARFYFVAEPGSPG